MDSKRERQQAFATAACENLTPDELEPALTGDVEPVYKPKGGRPPKTQLAALSENVSRNRERFLASAYQMILSNIANSVPMFCLDGCPHERACILDESERPRTCGANPESGVRCPIEHEYFYTMFYAYLAQLEIDVASPTEVQTAAQLAGIQVKKRRIDDLVNQHGMIIEQGVGTDKATGQAIVRYDEHPLLATLDRLEKREDAIKKQFFITREQIEAKRKATQSGQVKTSAQFLSDFSADAGLIIDVGAEG